MKHIKPGRGPSAMGAFGSIFAAVFGVIWTIAAVSMGAPWFFALFGVVFIGTAIVQAVYNYKNATGKHRYSEFDIVDSAEEPDPWNRHFDAPARDPWESAGGQAASDPREAPAEGDSIRYCPYCGARLGEGFTFCAQCGRKLPDIP